MRTKSCFILKILPVLFISFTALSGCGDDITNMDTGAGSPASSGPFTISASITPNQDLAKAAQVSNITVTFNEAMAESNLDLIRLERLGFKGASVPIGSKIFQNVSIATTLSSDKMTLIIDVDPTNEPNITPLDLGAVYAIAGFENLSDARGKPFNPSNEKNFLPVAHEPSLTSGNSGSCALEEPFSDVNGNGICDSFRFLRFSTNADATLLALSAAPTQVPNTAQNIQSFSGSGSNVLAVEFEAQAPVGAKAFRIYASPQGSVASFSLVCNILESEFADSPLTTFFIPLSRVASAFEACRRPFSAKWDDGLTLEVAVSVINADGKEGPLSSVLLAKDNVNPEASYFTCCTLSPLLGQWGVGAPAGNFQAGIRFNENMDTNSVMNPANYEVSSADGDSYTVTDVTSGAETDGLVVLHFTLNSGVASTGDSILLNANIKDEAGNSITSNALLIRGGVPVGPPGPPIGGF